jgi:hypothetical protein
MDKIEEIEPGIDSLRIAQSVEVLEKENENVIS